MQASRKLRMGLIGGGGAGFIGRVHALAATLDMEAELVACALSSDATRAKKYAPQFGVFDATRAYESGQSLIAGETQRPAEDRIDFVSIATPNYTHFEFAREALAAGFHVFCDKPMTTSLPDAEELQRLVAETRRVFVVTHNYTGYPQVRQMRQMIRNGEIGDILAIRARYIQGWLHAVEPGTKPARGAWKSDPAQNGPSGAFGDIGVHAYNLIRYVTELEPRELSSHLQTTRKDRILDDYGHALIRFDNDITAHVTASQITHGRLNDLTLEVDGTAASLSWSQENPNDLWVRQLDQPARNVDRNPRASYVSSDSRDSSRIPGGHPEGYLEAFANVYRAAFADIRRIAAGEDSRCDLYPNVDSGLDGVTFIERCVDSSAKNGKWIPFA